VRLVFAGTPQAAVASLEALIASSHEVCAVLTRPDAPVGRGRRMERSPVGQYAEQAGIPVWTPASVRDEAFLAELARLAPDACPIVAYGALIPREALDIPRKGWINLHFSLLPAWRGAAPVQHAIWHGDDITGASTFILEEGLDTGPVLGTVTEPIGPRDTSGDLLQRLAVSGAQLLVHTLDGLESATVSAVPQPHDGISLAPKIDVDDAHVDFAQPAIRVDRHIRACTPAPGAWAVFRGERLRLGPVSVGTDSGWDPGEVDELPPGAIRAGKRDVWVGTASSAVRLGDVTPAGKRPMTAADWARGVRIDEDVLQ
jgi:methionyl-tRNA formyltransferase